MKLVQRLATSDAHHRLLVAAVSALLLFIGLQGRAGTTAHIILTWDFFSFLMLAMAWVGITTENPQVVRRNASLQDSSSTLLFSFVIFSACACIFVLFLLLGSGNENSKGDVARNVALAVVTVTCSWLLVHTTFALRYAHLFYTIDGKSRQIKGEGLLFPGEKTPDYLDFAYFSFVVGMTCQVSDVQITSKRIRRVCLVHGLVSFVFNTIIVAMAINVVSGLIK